MNGKDKMKKKQKNNRPQFFESLSHTYSIRRKSLLLLTGDVNGLFYNFEKNRYLSMEQVLFNELNKTFNLIRMDIASGLTFYDGDTEQEVTRICESTDGYYTPAGRIRALKNMINSSKHSPLSALVLLQGIGEAFSRVRLLEPTIKPLCVVIQFAGSLFSEGSYSRLSDLDRQCLVSLLSWVSGPVFRESPEMIIFINSVKSEINSKITSLPHAEHIEVKLPDSKERMKFVNLFKESNPKLSFEQSKTRFIEDTAGLSLNHIKDLMEVAVRTKQKLSKISVTNEVNKILQAQLGDIIRIKYPSHSSADIIGYKKTGEIFKSIFERCEDVETAVSAILVSGPNGSGKTFQLEAFAAESGRVVIELAGIRGSYFGETDKFFEMLRWHISTFGKILILVDEAHTAFGSVHSGQTHKTEQRLSGNIIKMMGNPDYLGKVLWGMMTSRPDELDPDIKSRAPVQIPIFDMENEERKLFLKEMFKRKNIKTTEKEIIELVNKTDYYSARDYRNFIAEIKAENKKKHKKSPLEVLEGWQASKSIKQQREFQEMIASMHCSYPNLLPEKYKSASEIELQKKIELFKIQNY